MTARPSFSMMEVIFVIVILGVLSSVAVPKFVMSRNDACYAKLRANVAETQTILSRYYTKQFMQGKKTDDNQIVAHLKEGLVSNGTNDRCQFIVNSKTNIQMVVGNEKLTLTAEVDKDLNTLKLTCDLSGNQKEQCQKLIGKKAN